MFKLFKMKYSKYKVALHINIKAALQVETKVTVSTW